MPESDYSRFSKENALKYMQGYGVTVRYHYVDGLKKQEMVWTKTAVSLEEIEKTKRLLEVFPGAKVLDLGCGHGRFVYQTSLLGAYAIGVDFSRDRISALNEYFGENSFPPGKSFFQLARAEELPFSDSYFDRIVCYDLLEHLDDNEKSRVLGEAHRVLKPDGIAVFATDNLNYLKVTLPARRLAALFKLRDPFKIGIPLTPGEEDDSGHIGLIAPAALLGMIAKVFKRPKIYYSRNYHLDKWLGCLNRIICEDFPLTNFFTAAHYAIKCAKA